MISATTLEALLLEAHRLKSQKPELRYGQIVHDLLSQNGHIEFNPVVGTLDDLTSGNTNPYWINSYGGTYTDVYQLKYPEFVRASLYNEFWDGGA